MMCFIYINKRDETISHFREWQLQNWVKKCVVFMYYICVFICNDFNDAKKAACRRKVLM